jgi:aconitase B
MCSCRWDVSKLEPLVAAPHSPDNRKTARECSDVKIDRVYIGSCTGKSRCYAGGHSSVPKAAATLQLICNLSFF